MSSGATVIILSEGHTAEPMHAAVASAGPIPVAAAIPRAAAALAAASRVIPAVVVTAMLSLAGLGAVVAGGLRSHPSAGNRPRLYRGAAARAITAGINWIIGGQPPKPAPLPRGLIAAPGKPIRPSCFRPCQPG